MDDFDSERPNQANLSSNMDKVGRSFEPKIGMQSKTGGAVTTKQATMGNYMAPSRVAQQ